MPALIQAETDVIHLLATEALNAENLSASWFIQDVAEVTALQNQLVALLETAGSTDATFQVDLMSLVNNQGVLVDLSADIAGNTSTQTP